MILLTLIMRPNTFLFFNYVRSPKVLAIPHPPAHGCLLKSQDRVQRGKLKGHR